MFVNGCFIGRNDNGYAPFRFDLTDFLSYGAKNYITLRVELALATDGSTRELASTVTCGSPRPTRCTWASWESTVRTELKGGSALLSLSRNSC